MRKKLDVLKTALFFAVIVGAGHLSVRAWIFVHPASYEWLLHLFVAGLHVKVTDFDLHPFNIVLGTILESISAGIFGAGLAYAYNKYIA